MVEAVRSEIGTRNALVVPINANAQPQVDTNARLGCSLKLEDVAFGLGLLAAVLTQLRKLRVRQPKDPGVHRRATLALLPLQP